MDYGVGLKYLKFSDFQYELSKIQNQAKYRYFHQPKERDTKIFGGKISPNFFIILAEKISPIFLSISADFGGKKFGEIFYNFDRKNFGGKKFRRNCSPLLDFEYSRVHIENLKTLDISSRP